MNALTPLRRPALPLLAAGLLAAGALACGDEDAPTAAEESPVESMEVRPEQAVIDVGDTQEFSATARNAAGDSLPDVIVDWSSTRLGVATVDAQGTATARGPGQTLIVAEAGGVADTATLTVTPSPPGSG